MLRVLETVDAAERKGVEVDAECAKESWLAAAAVPPSCFFRFTVNWLTIFSLVKFELAFTRSKQLCRFSEKSQKSGVSGSWSDDGLRQACAAMVDHARSLSAAKLHDDPEVTPAALGQTSSNAGVFRCLQTNVTDII